MIRLLLGNMPEMYVQAVSESSDIELVAITKGEDSTMESVRAYRPEIVILFLTGQDSMDVTRRIIDELPETSVILFSGDQSVNMIKDALRAGAKDYLDHAATPRDVLAAVRQAYQKSESRLRKTQSTILMDRLHHLSKVITFVSAKGGVGKTTTAVNVGVTMAKTGKNVVIVDMDLSFGDVNLRLGLPDNPRNIYSLMLEGERYQEVYPGYLMHHESGLNILSAPLSVEEGEYITASYVQGLIRSLRKEFDYILIDTAPVMNDHFLTVIEASDQVLMFSVADLASVKNNRRMLSILQTLGNDLKKVRHVSVKKGTLNEGAAADVLESDFYASISFDGLAVGAAANLGIPVVIYSRHSKTSRDYQRLCDKLLSEEYRKSKSFFRGNSLRKKAKRRG